MKPSIGRIVIVRNHFCGSGDAPAIVTRVWHEASINVQVLPDCGPPTCKTSVPLYGSRDEAEAYLASMQPGHNPIVAFWPDRV